jgi:hypothetical protein
VIGGPADGNAVGSWGAGVNSYTRLTTGASSIITRSGGPGDVPKLSRDTFPLAGVAVNDSASPGRVGVSATGNSSGGGRADLGVANDETAGVTSVGVRVSSGVTDNGTAGDRHAGLARQPLPVHACWPGTTSRPGRGGAGSSVC